MNCMGAKLRTRDWLLSKIRECDSKIRWANLSIQEAEKKKVDYKRRLLAIDGWIDKHYIIVRKGQSGATFTSTGGWIRRTAMYVVVVKSPTSPDGRHPTKSELKEIEKSDRDVAHWQMTIGTPHDEEAVMRAVEDKIVEFTNTYDVARVERL